MKFTKQTLLGMNTSNEKFLEMQRQLIEQQKNAMSVQPGNWYPDVLTQNLPFTPDVSTTGDWVPKVTSTDPPRIWENWESQNNPFYPKPYIYATDTGIVIDSEEYSWEKVKRWGVENLLLLTLLKKSNETIDFLGASITTYPSNITNTTWTFMNAGSPRIGIEPKYFSCGSTA